MSTLAHALEALCKWADSELQDSLAVADLRGLMQLHNDEGFRAIAEAAASAETAEKIATFAEEAADDCNPPVLQDWLEYRDWFKDQLHELARQAREAGGVS